MQGPGWDAWYGDTFVDLCDEHRGTGSPQELDLRRLQLDEWTMLFDHCYRLATGG